MEFRIQKLIFKGFKFHYMNQIEEWKLIDSKSNLEDAKKKILEYASKEKGTYRISNFYNSEIHFSITT